MSDAHDPATTDIFPEAPPRSRGGRALVDLHDPAAVAELAERIAKAEGWRGTHAVTRLSIEEVKALARLAWAGSFVTLASMAFEQASIDGDSTREGAMRAELAAAHDAFMARFLPPAG